MGTSTFCATSTKAERALNGSRSVWSSTKNRYLPFASSAAVFLPAPISRLRCRIFLTLIPSRSGDPADELFSYAASLPHSTENHLEIGVVLCF